MRKWDKKLEEKGKETEPENKNSPGCAKIHVTLMLRKETFLAGLKPGKGKTGKTHPGCAAAGTRLAYFFAL